MKDAQLAALAEILPPTAEVALMLQCWRLADQRYWDGQLRPCWLTAGIEPYGKCLGSWDRSARTLNLVPTLFRRGDGGRAIVQGVVTHEACHQAQGQLYRHLDAAKGPRGKWFDTSHRCPSWSRVVEDVIRVEAMDVFCPVWHRSTNNRWDAWVPASEDWMQWKKADPNALFDGRRLLSFAECSSFLGPAVSLEQAVQGLGDGGRGEWTV